MTDSKKLSDACLDAVVNCSHTVIDKIDNTIQFSCALPEAIYQFYALAAEKVYRAIKTYKSVKNQKP